MFATMSTSSLPNSALLHGTPSPIGFEATLSVAMELESRLKAEMDGPDAKEQEGVSDGSLNGETDQSSTSLPPDMVMDEDDEDEEDGNGNSGSGEHCHICGYPVPSQFHLEMHMRTHGDHAIHSDGEGKGDAKDFQTDLESSDGFLASNQSPRVNSQGKVKTYRCKQCSFVALTKTDFWDHNKTHIKAEKLLTCPKCPFVTEYKHHLEYHLRNHFGSKPFKCSKCNYSCVNKSMLNSHMKSHSNIYQYRCSDCSYATKYCHSLKLHLRKYNHKPSTVLNPDGSPAVTPLIDVFGSRRGPRSKKGMDDVGPPLPYPPLQFPHLAPPYLYSSPILNGFRPFDNNGFPFVKLERSFMDANNGGRMSPILDEKELISSANDSLKCQMCEFSTSIKEHFNKHLLLHAAAENQDLCNLYGISSESLMVEQQQNANAHQSSSLPALPAPPPPPSGQQTSTEDAKPTEETGEATRYQPVIVRRQDTPSKDTAIPLDLSSTKDANHQHLDDGATKSRRKGKAFKLDRICLRLQGQSADEDSDTPPPVHHVIPGLRTAVAIPPSKRNMALLQPIPKLITIQGNGERTDTNNEQHPLPPSAWKEAYECHYCDISFKDCIMYTMHMGYHGYKDPFKCNMCGQHTQDKVSFFLHIARSAHV